MNLLYLYIIKLTHRIKAFVDTSGIKDEDFGRGEEKGIEYSNTQKDCKTKFN